MYALEIKNLNKSFGTFNLENINLKLPEGYILGYIGQNGAGKTTTIKLIMEQLKRDSGEIIVFGKNYTDDEIAFKDIIGYIADECYFPGCFTAKDVMDSLKSFYKSFDEFKFKSYIDRWGIPQNKNIKNFSKGMKIKLMFASVLCRETKLLLLDEPTSGLDPVIRSEILELLQEYISDGKRSVLFSTHIMSDLEKIADYLYFIDKGKTIFNDTKDNILEDYLLVKGGREDLTEQIKEKLIGYKKSNVGFEGLIHLRDSKYMGKGLLLEKPSVEDIVVFHINGARG
ncbi:ABC transporter ATP-binding protein [Clostridium polyendosporum]|uniref:ABC transporter ATP-binding protein n=1 Tax=Clostridium polyendosporum TaxID=69208 RepID=A0A919VH29_9CLOT|nr:ABC transporter ATP-binding protein [Clostridium polyendosporum]GIM29970.1 ABC transporter ATP-binding protein [Clostridium polyendosporum]